MHLPRISGCEALPEENPMKTIRWSFALALLVSATAAASGCDKKTSPTDVTSNEGRSNATVAAPEATAQNRSAVDSITAARCDREQRCNNIGTGKKFESRSSCVTNVRSDWQGELSSLECPRGIEHEKLETCLERLRTDGCANPVETLGRVAACRQAELCRAG
jgi:hypothetical protein